MSNNFVNRLLKASSVQSLRLFLTVFEHILLVPYFIKYWGVNEYGKYLTCLSLFALLMSLDNGFGNYFTNEYNLLFHKDRNIARRLMAASLKIVFVSNIVQMMIIILSIGIQNLFSIYIIENSILFGLLILSIYRFLFGGSKGLLVRSLFPLGFFHRSAMIGLGEAIMDLMVLFIGINLGMGFLRVIVLIACIKSFYAIFSFYLIYRWSGISILRYRNDGSFKEGFRSYKKSIPLMINSFMDKGSNHGLNTLVAIALGTASLPIFTTIKTMTSMVNRLVSLVVEPLTPELGRLHSLNEKQKILDIFRLSWVATSIFIAIPVIGFSFFSEEIYSYWLGGKLEFIPILYATLMVSSLMYSFGRPFISYMTSINFVKGLTIISFLRGLGILVLSFALIQIWGLIGLGWSSMLIEVVVSTLIPLMLVSQIWNDKTPFIKKKEIYSNFLCLLLIGMSIFFTVTFSSWVIVILLVSILIGLAGYQMRFVSPNTRSKIYKRLP